MDSPGISLTFISNFMNHHQRYLSDAFYELLGEGYHFVETVPFSAERKAGGWPEMEDKPYLIRAHESEQAFREAMELARTSDAVIIGSAPDSWISMRLREKKLTFRCHERWHKEPLPLYKWPRAVLGGWLHHGRFPSLHLLCAGAYVAADAARVGCFRRKRYQWGYFPEVRTYSRENFAHMKEKDLPLIIWAGRMLSWKHPETALQACAEARRRGFDFCLVMAGDGPERQKLQMRAAELGISDRTEFPGNLPHEKLRQLMEQADIFLFTSDRREGWGVVVNEAMNSGCAVIASGEAGASPCLIRDGENGFLFPCEDAQILARGICRLLACPDSRAQMGLRAYETIRDRWCPRRAAEGFLELYRALANLPGGQIPKEGPGSAAAVFRDIRRQDMKLTIREGVRES